MSGQMVTAKEFLLEFEPDILACCDTPAGQEAYLSSTVHEAMIEFAQLKVKEALLAASKTKRIDLFVRPDIKGSKYKKIENGESYDLFGTRQMWKVNKDSILNAYPLENIK